MSKKKQKSVTEAQENVTAEQRGENAQALPADGEAATEVEGARSVPTAILDVEAGTVVARTHPIETRAADATPKKGKKPKGSLTLADLAERYAAKMERDEKSEGTIASYSMELKTAVAELGADTLLDKLTPGDVAVYFGCDRVTKLKSGKPKSQLSIDKTRRVLRLALVWAAEAKLIAKAPLPEGAATH